MASNRNPEDMKRERESVRASARATHLGSVIGSVGKGVVGALGREVEPVLAHESKSAEQLDHKQLSSNMGGTPDPGKTSARPR